MRKFRTLCKRTVQGQFCRMDKSQTRCLRKENKNVKGTFLVVWRIITYIFSDFWHQVSMLRYHSHRKELYDCKQCNFASNCLELLFQDCYCIVWRIKSRSLFSCNLYGYFYCCFVQKKTYLSALSMPLLFALYAELAFRSPQRNVLFNWRVRALGPVYKAWKEATETARRNSTFWHLRERFWCKEIYLS